MSKQQMRRTQDWKRAQFKRVDWRPSDVTIEYPYGAILHFDASLGFTDQTGNQSAVLIGDAYPTVTAGYAINEAGAEWGFDTTTGPVRDALTAGEVTLVQAVRLPAMSSLTDATDYSLFGDLLFVRRDGTSGSFRVSDGTNSAVVAYDWSENEVVRVVVAVDPDGTMCVYVLPYAMRTDAEVAALFQPSTGLSVERTASGYVIRKRLGDSNKYQTFTLANATVYVDDFAVQSKFASTAILAGNLTGAGWGSVAKAESFGGQYWRTPTAGQYASFTTGACRSVGIRDTVITNAGFGLVAIDGDRTAANMLPTAAQLVASGVMAASCLVANGGALNPTDRILDQYASTAVYDRFVCLADDLANTAHTVVITCTGYKRSASSDIRLYISGWCAQSEAGAWQGVVGFTGGFDSAYELAASVVPDGHTFAWCGTIHGNETLTSVKVFVDGEEDALDVGESVSGVVTVERKTTLVHPTAGNAANVTITYSDGGDGIDVDVDVDWLVAGVARIYRGMLPLKSGLNRVSKTGAVYDRLLTAADGSIKYAGVAAAHYAIDTSGVVSFSGVGRHGHFEDRALDGVKKIYLSNTSNLSADEAIANGGSTGFSVKYQCATYPNPKYRPTGVSSDAPLPTSAQPCKDHALPIGTGKITVFPGVATSAQIEEAGE